MTEKKDRDENSWIISTSPSSVLPLAGKGETCGRLEISSPGRGGGFIEPYNEQYRKKLKLADQLNRAISTSGLLEMFDFVPNSYLIGNFLQTEKFQYKQ